MSRWRRSTSDEGGFALLAVIMVLALLGVVVTEFAFSMRLEASMVRAYRDSVLGRNLAEAAVQQAIREILTDSNVQAIDEDGQLAFYTLPPGGTAIDRLPPLPRKDVALGAGQFSYRITDEEGRLNLNGGQPERMQRLLSALGVEKIERDTIVDSIEDWRDANDTNRPNGAESDDYLKLPVPYRARNGNFQDTAELLQVKGVTPELYYGHDDKPGLVDVVTARGRGSVNLNTASPPVLSAMGFSDAEISDIVQARRIAPFPSVPARFTTGRRTTVQSSTFRIEAEGIVAGQPKTRVIAIVQKASGAGAAPTVAVLSWRFVPPRSGAKEDPKKS